MTNQLYANIEISSILEQIQIIGPDSLSIILLTAFCIGLIFSLQIIKEFLSLNAVHAIGSIITISFIRELSPVLTSIILIGKIGSFFTSELATMQITEQIDVLYILEIYPLPYLILPRVLALIVLIPLLNIISFFTSLFSSLFICFTIYNIDPYLFIISCYRNLFILDIMKSLLKCIIFGLGISIISCYVGIKTNGGAKGVGMSTTISVVTSLLFLFIVDFILSYYMFDNIDRSFII
uniref:ABC transporter permease n=1 Tax=Pleonosporium borreri TaxID=2575635 RepID=A0A4D6WX73_9FLOR|nr:hypothetical protein [Pleonosporium borreri]